MSEEHKICKERAAMAEINYFCGLSGASFLCLPQTVWRERFFCPTFSSEKHFRHVSPRKATWLLLLQLCAAIYRKKGRQCVGAVKRRFSADGADAEPHLSPANGGRMGNRSAISWSERRRNKNKKKKDTTRERARKSFS